MWRQQQFDRLILSRPAVEAGENLGFLPGDLHAKINPYLRPLLDALNEMMEPETVRRYMENDIIEIAPPHGATMLLPFSNAVVPKVDLAGGRVVIELPGEMAPKLLRLPTIVPLTSLVLRRSERAGVDSCR